jgi:hypothetical protein
LLAQKVGILINSIYFYFPKFWVVTARPRDLTRSQPALSPGLAYLPLSGSLAKHLDQSP